MAGRAASCHHLHLATRIISARLTSSTPARSATWVLPDQRVSASDSRLIDDACNCRRVVIIIAFDAGSVSPQAPRRYIRLPRRPAKQFRSSPCAQCVTGSAEWVRDEVFLNPSIGRSRSLAQALPDSGGIIQNKGEVERWYTVRETLRFSATAPREQAVTFYRGTHCLGASSASQQESETDRPPCCLDRAVLETLQHTHASRWTITCVCHAGLAPPAFAWGVTRFIC